MAEILKWSPRVKELEARVVQCEAALLAAQDELSEAKHAEFAYKVGDIVKTAKGTFKIASIDPWFSPLSGSMYAARLRKDGNWDELSYIIYPRDIVARVV